MKRSITVAHHVGEPGLQSAFIKFIQRSSYMWNGEKFISLKRYVSLYKNGVFSFHFENFEEQGRLIESVANRLKRGDCHFLIYEVGMRLCIIVMPARSGFGVKLRTYMGEVVDISDQFVKDLLVYSVMEA